MADQENHSWPLAPARMYQKSDEENPTFRAIRKERTSKCFVYILAGIVILSFFMLVFALVVLRPNSPDVQLSSVTVKNLRYATSPRPWFNATLVAVITIKNRNFGSFRFENTTASLLYDGVEIGEKKTIKSGTVNARDTEIMNVSIDVRSSRLPEGSNNLGNDLNSGTLKLSAQAKFSGPVHLVKILTKKKTTELNCTITLYLTSRTIKDLLCN